MQKLHTQMLMHFAQKVNKKLTHGPQMTILLTFIAALSPNAGVSRAGH